MAGPHYELLEPLTRESQCRCATSDGLRCDHDAVPGRALCTECVEHCVDEFELAARPGFGWWNTADYDRSRRAHP
jgi:hypothetical protein